MTTSKKNMFKNRIKRIEITRFRAILFVLFVLLVISVASLNIKSQEQTPPIVDNEPIYNDKMNNNWGNAFLYVVINLLGLSFWLIVCAFVLWIPFKIFQLLVR